MVKLLLFAPCERVIVGQEDGAVSLISLLGGIAASTPFPHGQIPENAVVPLRWYLLSLWRHDQDDLGKQFTQRIVLRAPSGKEALSAELPFQLPQSASAISVVRGITQFNVFPVGEMGTFVAKLFFRDSENSDWSEVAEYPLDVVEGPVIDLSKTPAFEAKIS
jgi:hypothetical protein